MTEIQHLADGVGRRPPSVGTILRHGIDAAAAPASFLVANALVGARWGAVVALAVALLVGAVRRLRGEPLVVVAVSTGLVALYSASAIAVGTGRSFFLPEVVLNVLGLAICVVGLLVRRPVTAAAHRRIRGSDAVATPAMRRFHDRLTLAWAGLFVLHVVPLVWLYAVDSVVGLTLVSSVLDKPTILLMAVASVVLTRRAAAADALRKDPL
ncbi:DUF3159 domain-containing protein [Nocardioides mangrovi]|uniref:DUF3159 domain-containing protein n=1 Tax=Nocardioides mangrovi TaxID=2874580 RepID=A0ABS7UE51_9ACTN|nr:DUF3159 domain-containing protein [Nocardioides mangrovi]MBZ5739140.1 DUF3159 domain-containing protein [Nocardioides mangrovi]